jgi:hypothetical protein
MVTLDLIDHKNVHELDLNKFISAFKNKTKSKTDADYLQREIINQNAFMVIIGENDQYQGYFALHANVDENDEIELLVWIAYTKKTISKKAKDMCMDKIKEVASELGASRILFKSNRNGWLKRASEYGFKMAEYTFEITAENF